MNGRFTQYLMSGRRLGKANSIRQIYRVHVSIARESEKFVPHCLKENQSMSNPAGVSPEVALVLMRLVQSYRSLAAGVSLEVGRGTQILNIYDSTGVERLHSAYAESSSGVENNLRTDTEHVLTQHILRYTTYVGFFALACWNHAHLVWEIGA